MPQGNPKSSQSLISVIPSASVDNESGCTVSLEFGTLDKLSALVPKTTSLDDSAVSDDVSKTAALDDSAVSDVVLETAALDDSAVSDVVLETAALDDSAVVVPEPASLDEPKEIPEPNESDELPVPKESLGSDVFNVLEVTDGLLDKLNGLLEPNKLSELEELDGLEEPNILSEAEEPDGVEEPNILSEPKEPDGLEEPNILSAPEEPDGVEEPNILSELSNELPEPNILSELPEPNILSEPKELAESENMSSDLFLLKMSSISSFPHAITIYLRFLCLYLRCEQVFLFHAYPILFCLSTQL
ncbi:MAG: hypothetical protein IJU23_13100 [Proteobacteria bacterium]|nr:hypothetical protein [Pseudomonadota bacterium]